LAIIIQMEYVVDFDKHDEFTELLKVHNEAKKDIKQVKSVNIYKQTYGGQGNAFIELWECDSMADVDVFMKEAYAIPEYRDTVAKLMSYYDPTGFTRRVWTKIL
jgi:hypothetical protein